jgi:predicted amidohydrolase YtcJ
MNKFCVLLACFVVVAVGDARAADGAAPPDVVYHHGKVVTLEDALGTQQAFAVRGERITAVGSDATVLALAGRGTRRVDLRGATVIPGLNDSHDHLWNAGRYLYDGVDMVGVSTLAELQRRVRTAVARATTGQVVYTTSGWSVEPLPTRAMLDQISGTVPIVLVMHRRGASVWNTAALQRVGVSKANPVFQGTRVPVDTAGEPTGTLAAGAPSARMVNALLPPSTPPRQEQIIGKAMRERNALGITSIRDLALFPEAVTALRHMHSTGKLTLRIGMGLEFPDVTDVVAHVATLPPLKFDDLSFYVDSWSEEPWPPVSTTPEEFTRLARAANRQGWRLAPHTNSDSTRGGTADAATEAVLAAYEAADRDSPLRGKRWLLEHVHYATPEQMERMAKLGLTVSVQYLGYTPPADAPLPPQRMAHLTPIRGFLEHKVNVIGGSDYAGPNPVERASNNPMLPFYFYVTRRTRGGEIRTPDEIISREQALKIFTVNPAYAAFAENDRGRIAPGLLADFVVLNQDLMTVADDRILATRPLATFVGGRKVFEASGASF